MVPSRGTLDRLVPEVVFGVLRGTLNNFLFWMDCGHLFLITWWFEQQFWYNLHTLYLCICVHTWREVLQHDDLWRCWSIFLFVAWKFIVYWSIQLFIRMAGGQRPPLLDYDLLVLGGRPKVALADEDWLLRIFVFQGLWPMVYQASLAIATFATESRVCHLHVTCHKHKINISFGPPLAGLIF